MSTSRKYLAATLITSVLLAGAGIGPGHGPLDIGRRHAL
jgi:hypothetical protein